MGYGTSKCINVPIGDIVIALVSIFEQFYKNFFDPEVDVKVILSHKVITNHFLIEGVSTKTQTLLFIFQTLLPKTHTG